MARIIDIERGVTLDDYAAVGHLAHAVHELRAEAARLVPRLRGRRVWMVNSTARGGGVAEMLPTQVSLLRELGVHIEWAVIEGGPPAFFPLTKRIHNLIHGEGDPELGPAERELYETASRKSADALGRLVGADDILIVHDPQPLGAGAMLRREMNIHTVWRCHIGLDEQCAQTRAAWSFLEPYATAYDHAVFTAPEYIPSYLAGRASIIHPAVDPLAHKNQDLALHKLVGILCDSALSVAFGPVLSPPFPEPVQRLQPDGNFLPATMPEDIGLLFRPVVTQISRWDRLKGFAPLMNGFRRLKERNGSRRDLDRRHRRSLEIVRLVLAGPDPASIQDDPEAREVLSDLQSRYLELEPEVQADIAIVTLPMHSREQNALMVNALQRCSTIVAQNSLREGFGLTATEAMWKGTPVLGTHACGLQQQIRDGLDGRLVSDPEDADELARTLDQMLADEDARDAWGRSAHRRVRDEFLIFTQLRRWLAELSNMA